jgi:hypothetical protein
MSVLGEDGESRNEHGAKLSFGGIEDENPI